MQAINADTFVEEISATAHELGEAVTKDYETFCELMGQDFLSKHVPPPPPPPPLSSNATKQARVGSKLLEFHKVK